MKHDLQSASHASDLDYEIFRLTPHAWVPNNRHLPVLVYRRALDPSRKDLGPAFEALFARNEWPPQWRDSIFDYHHFHSTAHEVLGVISGKAEVIVGGPGGLVVSLEAGDVVLLPAGSGHCLQATEGRFQVVGAYPEGQQWDIRRDALSEGEIAAMEVLPFPRSDPVGGREGPLLEQWT
ncbi:cupin domain-containing protein [Caballeronia sp. LjRoot34]|uniref:cupin domain-containing protein n=1 Tax=Caballeronia sp. LjRoot34 TaxID=3342325 RepID=UPI003ECD7B25